MTQRGGSRILWVDTMKGICIILMVLGHTGAPFSKYIYLFHMAAFIILSGYTCNAEKYTVWQFVKRKFLTLVVPFYCVNLMFIFLYAILRNSGLNAFIPETEPAALPEAIALLFRLRPSTPDLGGATWFLTVLFIVEVLYRLLAAIVLKFRLPEWSIWGGMTILASLGWWLIGKQHYLPFNLDLGLLACFFYTIGIICRKCAILETKIPLPAALPIAIVVCVFFAGFYFSALPVNWPTRQFPALSILLACSVCGFYVCYCAARLLEKIPYCGALLQKVGRHTLSVLNWHFVAFRVCSTLLVVCFGRSKTLLNQLTPTGTETMDWCVYSVFAVVFCMVLALLAKKNRVLNYLINADGRRANRTYAGGTK